MVIDPLFSTPATLAEWFVRQSGPNPTHTSQLTDASVYLTSQVSGTGYTQYDPNYPSTNVDLNAFRFQFRLRCLVNNPPGPPYFCP